MVHAGGGRTETADCTVERPELAPVFKFDSVLTEEKKRVRQMRATMISFVVGLFAFAQEQIAANHCPFNGSPGYGPDVCDGKRDTGTCKPFSPLAHGGSYASWVSARKNLIKTLWGGATPPTRAKPDVGPTPFTTPVV